MTIYLAFDIYGTVIDTAGIAEALRKHAGDAAPALAQALREKQLEYIFRRGAMDDYRDFAVCTRQALQFVCARQRIALSPADADALMERYRHLPAYADALAGLAALRKLPQVRLYAFSMGRPDDLEQLLRESGARDFFIDVISTYDARLLKPRAAAYGYFHRRAGTNGAESWLVSGNPFDVIGGMSAGMLGAWVRRSADAVFDPWEIQPTVAVGTITELATAIAGRLGA